MARGKARSLLVPCQSYRGIETGRIEVKKIIMQTKPGLLGVGFFIVIILSSYSQQADFPELKGPYLGQKPPGKTPEIFAPGIVSVDRYGEFVCMFSPQGNECIFDRYGDDEYANGAVFMTRIENGKWIKPEIFALFSKFEDVFLPTLSPDGKYWFFTSNSLPVPDETKRIIPMYFMKKTETGWTEPEYLTQSIHASMTLDGTVYLNSGREIISQPELKTVIDLYGLFPFEVGHPVISPDGSYLIFDNGELADQRDCKLFVSFKQNNGSWSDPISLGRYIKQHAFCAWISYDGKYVFFHSRDSAKGNIYWISAEIIEELKSDLE
jgi:Tol biopolymer transport system component